MNDPLNFVSHQYASPVPGPKLIITAAVHGNEVCGSYAVRRLMVALAQGSRVLRRGRLTLVPEANPLAVRLGQRSGDRNLNRNLRPTDTPQEFEDHIANWLCPLLAAHEVLLDLHSFQSQGQPFVFLGPQDNQGALEPFAHAAEEQALAQRLGVGRAVDGWLATYAMGVERRRLQYPDRTSRQMQLNTDACYGVGTTEYMRQQGGWALTLECGQHQDAQAPEVAWQAIINTLAHLQMIDAPEPKRVPMETLHLYDVVDKANPADRFIKPWVSFDPVLKGQVIGFRGNGGEVLAADDGYIVFPSPNAQTGQEWFYLARASDRLKA